MEYEIEIETRAGRWNITGHVTALRVDLQQRWGLRFPRAPWQVEHHLLEQETAVELEAVALIGILPDGWERGRAVLHLTAPDTAPLIAVVGEVRSRYEYRRQADGTLSEWGWPAATEIRASALPLGQPIPILYQVGKA
jgi:hypothetical protein